MNTIRKLLLLVLLLSMFWGIQSAQAKSPVVRAVLFFSPTCPHCHYVMEEVLPPIKDKYKEQFVVFEVDVSTEAGFTLYQAAIDFYSIPQDRLGVPTMIVGQTNLVGSLEIPQQLPGIIEGGLSSGGIAWPEIPGLVDVLPASERGSEDADKGETGTGPLFMLRFAQDPIANTIAVIVLVGMLASVVGASYAFIADTDSKLIHWPAWAVPVLAVIGLGVAGYLSYTGITRTEVVCGPFEGCDDVQNSPYAILFGMIPVGVLGFLGYIAILAAWLLQYYGPAKWKNLAALAIWGMAWFGIVFSIYLTFLEPFVIGATCAWCITSAIVMTLIFWASTGPAKGAWKIEEED